MLVAVAIGEIKTHPDRFNFTLEGSRYLLLFSPTREENRKPGEGIKPISYLKAHAAEVIRDITDNRKTLIITQNGEAKVVVQDVKAYEKTQESLTLLKILALSSKNIKEGNVKPLDQAFRDLKKRVKKQREL